MLNEFKLRELCTETVLPTGAVPKFAAVLEAFATHVSSQTCTQKQSERHRESQREGGGGEGGGQRERESESERDHQLLSDFALLSPPKCLTARNRFDDSRDERRPARSIKLPSKPRPQAVAVPAAAGTSLYAMAGKLQRLCLESLSHSVCLSVQGDTLMGRSLLDDRQSID